MHLISLEIEPPHSVVGVGLQFGGHIDEVRFCVSDVENVIGVTCDAKGSFVMNFSLPSCWLESLIYSLEANNLEYAGHELIESFERFASRPVDEHGEAIGQPVPDKVVSYYTIGGAYPHRIKKEEAAGATVDFIGAGRQKKN